MFGAAGSAIVFYNTMDVGFIFVSFIGKIFDVVAGLGESSCNFFHLKFQAKSNQVAQF